MTKTPPQKKTGALRRAFNYAGAAFLSVYLAGPALVAEWGDVTGTLAQKLNLPVNTVKAMTRGRGYILHPESDSARAFAYLMESSALREAILEQSTPAARSRASYDFMGISYSHPFFGQNGFLNKITLGQSGKLAPCYVFFPSDRLTMEGYFETMSFIPLKHIKNRPGSWTEYQKLILFHELAHCNQPVNMPAAEREIRADQTAYDSYLQQGGDKDVVRAALSLRTAMTLTNIIFNGGAGKTGTQDHNAIALLYTHYLGGTPVPPEVFTAVQDEAYRVLSHTAQTQGMNSYDLLVSENLYRITKATLAEEAAINITPHSAAFLKHYIEAYEFLTRSPERKTVVRNEPEPVGLSSGPAQIPPFPPVRFAAGLP